MPRSATFLLFASRHTDPSPVTCPLLAAARDSKGASTRSLVPIMPALQARAALRGRDYVSGEDIEALAPRVFGHRIDLAPGVTSAAEVLKDASAEPLERLARSTLRRR